MADEDVQVQDPEEDEEERRLVAAPATRSPVAAPDAAVMPIARPVARPVAAPSPIAPPSIATPSPAPASAPALVSGAPPQPVRPVSPVAPPQPHQGFLENLYNKESGIKNPFLRTVAKVGTGIGRAAEGIASPLFPELSFVPGTQLNAMAQNRQEGAARAEAAKERVEQENAAANTTKAQAAQTGAATGKAEIPIKQEQADTEKSKVEKTPTPESPQQKEQAAITEKFAALGYNPQFDAQGQIVGVTPVQGFQPKPNTDVIQRTEADGKVHNILVDKGTGQDIKDMGQGSKANQMFGSTYAAVRLVDMAALYAPNLMPFALENLNKATGGSMTPEQLQNIAENARAGLATFNGQPLGVRSHLNPTPTTETQAQMADKVMTEIPRVKQEITTLAPNLGPVSGRAVTGFLAGTVGSTGDPELDQALGTLRTDWPLLMSATSKMHIGTQKAIEDLERTNNIAGSSSKILTGFLDSVSNWAKQAQKEGRNITAPREGGAGVTVFKVGGKTYNIPADKVAAFKKAFPKAKAQ
jgi:hypothetical protein